MPKIEFDAWMSEGNIEQAIEKMNHPDCLIGTLQVCGEVVLTATKRFHVTLTPISNNEEQKHAQEREDAGPTEGRV